MKIHTTIASLLLMATIAWAQNPFELFGGGGGGGGQIPLGLGSPQGFGAGGHPFGGAYGGMPLFAGGEGGGFGMPGANPFGGPISAFGPSAGPMPGQFGGGAGFGGPSGYPRGGYAPPSYPSRGSSGSGSGGYTIQGIGLGEGGFGGISLGGRTLSSLLQNFQNLGR